MLFLSACSHSIPAPVRDLHQNYHQVVRGETLYSIAFRYGLDYRTIAKLNHLSAPYKIHPGQKLHLRTHKSKANLASTKKLNITPQPHPNRPIVKQTMLVSHKKVKNIKWQWPAKGSIISSFSPHTGGNSGIDIAGQLAQPIYAAASGTVVYCGSGIRGYGKLIIVKHSDEYLSAYAHNSQLLVKEGDPIQIGQLIAKMGQTGNTRVKLHFEIRRAGKPVNPLNYLPKP